MPYYILISAISNIANQTWSFELNEIITSLIADIIIEIIAFYTHK